MGGRSLRVRAGGAESRGRRAGALSPAKALTRFAHAERISGGGCEAWFTLMSGETCTGGTILSVTLAPEAQFGMMCFFSYLSSGSNSYTTCSVGKVFRYRLVIT